MPDFDPNNTNSNPNQRPIDPTPDSATPSGQSPQPRTSKTVVIALIVAAVVVVGIILAILLSRDSSDDTTNGGNGGQTSQQDPEPYVDEAVGFSMQYPAGWERDEDASSNVSVIFEKPEADELNGESLSARVGVSLEEDTRTLDVIVQDALNRGPSQFGDFTVLRNDDITINGVAAKALSYSATVDDNNRTFSQVFIRKDDATVYLLSASSFSETWDNYKDEVEAAFDSFKILE